MKRKTALLGRFSALAIILGYIELLIPSGIPGVKSGLANLAVLFLLMRYSWREAALVSVIRIMVIGFLFTNAFSILYSLAGAFLSLLAMALLKRCPRFSIFGISMAGGIAHNIGQLLLALAIVENTGILYYAPVLLLSGVLTGLLVGWLTSEIAKRIRPDSA